MPEWQQHPPNKLLYCRSFEPLFMVKRNTSLQRLCQMRLHSSNDVFINPYQHYFMLIPETPVIKVCRTNSKNLIVNQNTLGVKICKPVKKQLDIMSEEITVILAAQKINRPYITAPGSQDFNIYASS